MSPDRIYDKYYKFFHYDEDGEPMGYMSIPDEWLPIVEDMCEELTAFFKKSKYKKVMFKFSDIKEKYNYMRCSYYLNTGPDSFGMFHNTEFYNEVSNIIEKHCIRVRPDKQGDDNREGSS